MEEVFRQTLGQWSPNGKYLAGAQQNRLQIREPDSMKLLQVFICIDKVERIQWSPDSQFLLTEVARQGLLQVWSMRDAEWSCRIYEGPAGIASARWINGETVLVTTEFQLYLSLWQLDGSTEAGSVAQIQRPKFGNRGVALSRDQCWLAVLRRLDCKDRLGIYNCEERYARLTDAVLPGDAANLAWGPDDNTPHGLKLRGFDIQSHGSGMLSGEDHQEGAVREKWAEVAQPGTWNLAGGPR
ncbi:unnamed protein product [Effrenium voratum]|nr:unnamed protein product [Effrenium voratum]